MSVILDGKQLSNTIKQKVKSEVELLVKEHGKSPHLVLFS